MSRSGPGVRFGGADGADQGSQRGRCAERAELGVEFGDSLRVSGDGIHGRKDAAGELVRRHAAAAARSAGVTGDDEGSRAGVDLYRYEGRDVAAAYRDAGAAAGE